MCVCVCVCVRGSVQTGGLPAVSAAQRSTAAPAVKRLTIHIEVYVYVYVERERERLEV